MKSPNTLSLTIWIKILRISIGIIYIWFGVLNFFHGVSPAEGLAKDTIEMLTLNLIPSSVSILLLAIWETAAGLLLISGYFLRMAIAVVLVHMACTFTPLLFFPDLSFSASPYAFTLIGQYIMKNIVIVSALMVIYKFEKEKKDQ